MEPLFFLDSRLRELTRRPFPSSESPFFLDYITDAPQSALRLINSELIHLHHHLPPNPSSVPTSLADDEPMILIQEYQRRSPHVPPPLINSQLLQHHQMPAFENSLSSRVPDYGYVPPPSLPRHGTIFTGQYMGHSLGEQSIMPSSCNSCQVTTATSHGLEGYDYNNNPSPMNFAHPGNNQGIVNQDMGHHLGFASSSNATGMDVHSSSSYCPITYRNHQSGQEGPIYPELGSNHYRNHEDHQYMVGYNTANSVPNEHMNGDDEVRMGSCFWGDKPPHFMP
ncbi:uncharacterized protein LOC125315577 [Rhodamnia argentea]|uniref:Uncharacterized protein LOC125315577 n=1 Tax=Rhodamnia argentea TaxID=178133 RepID=A0ABM3HJR9_9MYRT|nr:uncharacterized protein LOC125315577 [Rhodamnia argentea]